MADQNPTAPRPLDLQARETPLVRADRLGRALGFEDGALWIKRDDIAGNGCGGNKARKLEYLCADAIAQGCDTLVTGGAPQSNHVRMSGAAAARFGLGCAAVLNGDRPSEREGNLRLDQLFGIELTFTGEGGDMGDAFRAVTAGLLERGRTPYKVPLGGSSPVGVLGYVDCADEIEAGAPADSLVVCADGSGGTHAGLVAGLGDHARVLGVNVGFDALDPKIPDLAAEGAALAGRAAPVGSLQLDDGQPEPYGEPTDKTLAALQLVAETEGLMLDPVYSGRAMAALIDRRRSGAIAADQPVVFIHTGGLPALFTSRYRDWFQW